ncbi:MAG: hypothetical protein WAO58_04900 [Fimbriimonadaceae bacterium]
MIFKTVIAALMAAALIAGCAPSPPEPEAGTKVESKAMVPDDAKKIDGAGGGGPTESPE